MLGGFRRIPGICYPESVDLPRRSRQLAWRAAVQMCKNASQLALQVSSVPYYHAKAVVHLQIPFLIIN